jgi:hydroxymethyl cephem carbamoyltransferase
VLVWEGLLGGMYRIDANVSIQKLGDVLPEPGDKYSLAYALADPTRRGRWFRFDDAGKLMALAAFGTPREPTALERQTIETIMGLDHCTAVDIKTVFRESPYCGIGVESQELKDLAWQLSRALFDRFYQFAKQHVEPGHPLLIVGGCGLNCDWNSQWRECGLFSDTFVPPCTNDAGVAIGAGIDALHHYTGQAKIDWDVYAGDPFIEDMLPPAQDFACDPLSLRAVCEDLRRGDVIAWVQGRYEIGPRALGNRSMLAAPFSAETRDKLNRIKQRDAYRPIAPVCLLEEFERHFESRGGESPHMLYFQRVRNPQLAGVTHVDGSARAQSVSDAQNPRMAALLRAFGELTGIPVLCNTSLNFKGRGFVNRMSQLCALVQSRGLDGMVVGDRYWRCRPR